MFVTPIKNKRCVVAAIAFAAVVNLLVVSVTIGAEPPIVRLTISPDGKTILAASQAGVAVCDTATFKPSKTLPTRLESVYDIQFARDGDSVMLVGGSAGESGEYEWRSWPQGKLLGSETLSSDLLKAVAEVSVDRWIAAAHDGALIAFSTKDEKQQTWVEHSKGVNDVASFGAAANSAPEQWAVSASSDNTIRVWSATEGKRLRTLDNHTRTVRAIGVRPANEGLPMIASASADRTIRFWQPTIGRMVRFVRLDSKPLSIAWKPTGDLVLATTEAGQLVGVDPETAEIVFTKPAIKGWAYGLAIDSQGKRAFVAGQAGEKKIVSLE